MNQILLGNCLDVLPTLKGNSVDAVITDPPYGLGNKEPTLDEIIAYLCGLSELDTGGDFKGADWFIPSVSVWRECYRVLKPGGHLLSFGGTRTHDLISMGLRAAGFHSRDTIQMLSWVTGQGFPKSANIAKKIGLGTSKSYSACEPTFRYDKPCECDQENQMDSNVSSNRSAATGRLPTDTGREDSAMGRRCVKCRRLKEKFYRHIESLGTSLKPSWEPILVFRKPFNGSVSQNVLKYGTGAYNIEETRVGSRWPANVVFVHGPDCEVVGKKRVKAPVINRFDDGMKPFGEGAGHAYTSEQRGDSEGMEEILIYECQEGCPVKDLAEQNSSAPKFFAQFKYVKKANKRERGEGNDHPTVKPLDLMEWLVKLVSPEGGTVLDVYCGSGTTCLASKNLGRNFIGIERDPKFFEIATGRLQTMAKQD